MLPGLMQEGPLNLQLILRRAQELFPRKTVLTKTSTGFLSASYAEVIERSTRLASALAALGVRPGDRIATFAWNSQRHLELYFAVPCMGAVLHTLNVRLDAETLNWMITQAEDQVVFIDASLLSVWRKITPPRTLRIVVVMNDGDGPPADAGSGMLDYEDLINGAETSFSWPKPDENAAAGLCFTSATTGRPKGVVYSHRSIVLHSLSMLLADGIALRERDVCMPVVPQFHANAWGFPHAALLAGSSLAFAGRTTDPEALASTIETAGVTVATAVPTVWHNLLNAVQAGKIDHRRLASLDRLPVGGAAVSERLMDGFADLGIRVMHCWGMTEVSPLGTVNGYAKSTLPPPAAHASRLSQGLPLPLCRTRLIGHDGQRVGHDGQSIGELQISGPWVARAYYDASAPDGVADALSFSVDANGTQWLRTGDMAVTDPEGYVYLVDRSKDLIKSGGEWISSTQVEMCLMEHAGVTEAAVVGRPHPKWGERPVAFVIAATNAASAAQLLEHLGRRFPKWQLPDEIVFTDDLPRGATGKTDKRALRKIAASTDRPAGYRSGDHAAKA